MQVEDMIFLFENGPAVSVIDYLLALFDTTSRAMGGKLNCAGAHSGRLTPPRIYPSCPHCVVLHSRAVAGQGYHYR